MNLETTAATSQSIYQTAGMISKLTPGGSRRTAGRERQGEWRRDCCICSEELETMKIDPGIRPGSSRSGEESATFRA